MKTIFTTTDISTSLQQHVESPAELSAKIVTQMHAGVAHFTFKKKDGSIREAYGTLKKETLEKMLGLQEDQIKPTEPVPNSEQITQVYFDLEAMAFRSYTIANLVTLY